jgi:PST family polysaccharide transporter
LSLIKNIIKSPLFRVSSLNTVSVGVRIAGGLVASKVIALFIGPAGLALVGNFRNFITSVEAFSTLGFQNGIIKFVAENKKDDKELQKVLSTIFITILAAIVFFSIILFFGAGYLNTLIFSKASQYAWIFKILAFSLPWYTGNLVFIAVLNGLEKYNKVISITIWGNISGVALSALLIWKLGVPGAMLGLIFTPALMFLFSFYLVYRQFKGKYFFGKRFFEPILLKGLFSYSIMSLFTALAGPVVYLSVRNTIIHNAGYEEAGFWEAVSRISVFYLMFISTLLTTYFLPKLSIAQKRSETRSIFWSYYKNIVPVFIIGLIAVYILRDFIIGILFTKEFMPMEKLFLWQLLGDFFKVCSLILGYEFFAKKMTRSFIVTEAVSFGLLYVFSVVFVKQYGSEGAVMAHALTYFIYLLILLVYFRKKLLPNAV